MQFVRNRRLNNLVMFKEIFNILVSEAHLSTYVFFNLRALLQVNLKSILSQRNRRVLEGSPPIELLGVRDNKNLEV